MVIRDVLLVCDHCQRLNIAGFAYFLNLLQKNFFFEDIMSEEEYNIIKYNKKLEEILK